MEQQLSFGDALLLLQQGLCVRRSTWVPGIWIAIKAIRAGSSYEELCMGVSTAALELHYSGWVPCKEDLFAKDWLQAESTEVVSARRLAARPTIAMSIDERIIHAGGKIHANLKVEFANTLAVAEFAKSLLRDYRPTTTQIVIESYKPDGYLLEWPIPGGKRELQFAVENTVGDIIGAPAEPVYKASTVRKMLGAL